MNKQLHKLVEIYKERGFKSIDDFIDYQNTNSYINFLCDKGHVCKTKARYVLYEKTGCKTCQYENKKSILNVNLEESNQKICNYCNIKKNKTCFGKLSKSSDGLRNTCKLCRRKKTYTDSIEIKKIRSHKSLNYCKNNPFKTLYSRCKSSTNKKGFLDFDIDAIFLEELYIKQLGKCYWSGIEMCKDSVGLGKLNTISVDRIDCNIGYTRDNVVLSCKFINLGRGNANKDEFKEFLVEKLNLK